MTKLFSSLRTFGVYLCVAAVLVLRLLSAAQPQNDTMAYVIYGVLLFGGILLLWDCFDRRRHPVPLFRFHGSSRLYVLCYAAAVGFFAEFVTYCHLIYQSIENGVYHLPATFAPLCLVCAGALLSGCYCCAVGVSFQTERYDFRRLRLMHIMPVLWASGHMLQLLTVNDVLQPHTVLKYAVIAAALLFFFFLVIEVERGAGALWMTMFLIRAFYWLALLFFADTVILLLAGKATLLSVDTELTAAMLLIGGLALFLHRNSVTNTSMENH